MDSVLNFKVKSSLILVVRAAVCFLLTYICNIKKKLDKTAISLKYL